MEALEGKVIELAYALDTFYFLVMGAFVMWMACLLYTSPSPRDLSTSRMPSSA